MAKADSNIFPDADTIRDKVARLDAIREELLSERGEYMARCKALRELAKDVYDEVNNLGVSKRAFRAFDKRRELRSKLEGEKVHLDSLELVDELDKLEQALSAWEATPLGGAKKKSAAA
jgi:chromosome segregation ATPase